MLNNSQIWSCCRSWLSWRYRTPPGSGWSGQPTETKEFKNISSYTFALGSNLIFQRGLSLHGLSRGSDAGEVADDLLGVLGLARARFAAEKLRRPSFFILFFSRCSYIVGKRRLNINFTHVMRMDWFLLSERMNKFHFTFGLYTEEDFENFVKLKDLRQLYS